MRGCAYLLNVKRDAKQTLQISSFELLDEHDDDPDRPKTAKHRRFRMLAYSGVEVSRIFGRAIFDISGIDTGAKLPILLDHDSSQRAGFADKIRLGDSIELEGVISRVTGAGREVEELSDEGFPWQASIQLLVASWEELEPGATATVNGREVIGPISIARQSRLLESSFLMAGADKDTFAVALGAQEQDMEPKAFEAAHPEAVKAWRDGAATQARKEAGSTTRQELAAYLKLFPGREAWAASKFSEGLSAVEAKAALSDVLQVELAAAKTAPLAAAPASPEQLTLAKLAAAAQPGVGFNGPAAQGDAAEEALAEQLLAALPLEQRCAVEFHADPELRAEFANRLSAYTAWARHEAEGAGV